jgi:hypothetical protein
MTPASLRRALTATKSDQDASTTAAGDSSSFAESTVSTAVSSAAASLSLPNDWNPQDCRYCRGITLEKLSAPGGYRHASSRASLIRSAQKCKLCSFLFRRDRTRHASALWLSLDRVGDDDGVVCMSVGHDSKTDFNIFLYTLEG